MSLNRSDAKSHGAHEVIDLVEIFRRTLASIDLAQRVERALSVIDPPLPAVTRLLAVGKAAHAMALGALRVVRPVEPALVVTGRGGARGVYPVVPFPVRLVRAGHPLPDRASVRAAREALAMADRARRAAPGGSALVVLVSGGTSALLCAPIAGLDLETKRRVTRALLHAGVGIAIINDVRAHLSDIKGGKLACAAGDARVVTLVASDVLGPHDLERVGSGPTLGPNAPRREAIRIASASDLARAGVRVGRSLGAVVHRLPPTDEDVESVAERYAALREPGLHLAVGEPSVRITGRPGRGGRAQHLALLVARRIQGRRMTFLAAGSDGVDGASGAAGAIVDGASWRTAVRRGLDPKGALCHFDSARVHRALGTAIITGPTGLNLLDLHLVSVV